MIEKIMLPISKSTMPCEIEVFIEGKQFGDLIDAERYTLSTPDGERDNEVYDLVFVDRKTQIVYRSVTTYIDGHTYPTIENTAYVTSLGKGIANTFRDGEYVGQKDVPLDMELVERAIRTNTKEVA